MFSCYILTQSKEEGIMVKFAAVVLPGSQVHELKSHIYIYILIYIATCQT